MTKYFSENMKESQLIYEWHSTILPEL